MNRLLKLETDFKKLKEIDEELKVREIEIFKKINKFEKIEKLFETQIKEK